VKLAELQVSLAAPHNVYVSAFSKTPFVFGSGGQLALRRIADIHDRYVSREKTTLLARPEERVRRILQNLQFAVVPLGGGSCDSQNRTSIYCLRP
jgi:hypothetical protein